MKRSALSLLLAVTLAAVACGGASEQADTEVLGISVERDGPSPAVSAPSARPSSAATPDPEPEPAASPTVEAPSPEPTRTPSTTSAPKPTSAPQPQPTADPSPSPDPGPEPTVLGSGEGGGYSRWSPNTEPPEECCWVELDGAPPVERDGDPTAQALRGQLVDPDPAVAGEAEPWQRRSRRVSCDARIVAPQDRDLVARGTATIVLTYGDGTLAQVSHPVDVRVPAGTSHALPRPEPSTVHADDGRPVSCTVRFEAR